MEIYDVVMNDPQNRTPLVFSLDSPLLTIWRDLFIVVRNLPILPLVFWPIPKPGVDVTHSGVGLQLLLTVVSLAITALALGSFFSGVIAPVLVAVMLAAWIGIINVIKGKDRVIGQTIPGDDKYPNETWLFVNGIATSRSGLQLILNAFYTMFGRKVIGVENRTFGIWFDLVECLLQRDLVWQTTDTREGYNIIAGHIAGGKKDKIVLMAHSQGGIIMSSWVDQLLADFSPDQLGIVEIYTFASAANHFSIPASNGIGPFARVEHFVNSIDFVPRIGLIAFAPPAPPGSVTPAPDRVPTVSGRFAGRIFKRVGHTGHLLLTHYLKPGDSILQEPGVSGNSWLAGYLQRR
ncbi:hypothetical protein IAU60_003728 [Kwoniella sp. DSM 27419]